jgi:hypothetical protein
MVSDMENGVEQRYPLNQTPATGHLQRTASHSKAT